jgi:hypothetical protein
MSTVNYTNPNKDLTVRLFDQFYSYEINVPADEYDIVHSYFLTVMSTKQAAGNFTMSLFRVAQDTGISALTLLDEFQGLNGNNLSASLAYYLNSIRSRATLLGVATPSSPNFYQARNVLA